MSKFAAFCAKPITYGAYFKVCGLGLAVCAIELLVLNAYLRS